MRLDAKTYPRTRNGMHIDIEVPTLVQWSALERGANFIVRRLVRQWAKLLKQPQRAEAACHRFLAENAGIFLQRAQNFPAMISKLRLGAEFVTDLVLVENCYSEGAKYHLLELESPLDPLFTKKGVASQPLLAAIHQVIGWKSWLEAHRGEARRLFPSLMHGYNGDAVFTYSVVIGRRVKDPELLKRRRELAANLGIGIRSFDSMADGITNRWFHDTMTPISGAKDKDLDDEDLSELDNPFRRALTDPDLRELVRGELDGGHFYHAVGMKYRSMGRHSRHLAAFRKWAREHGHLPAGPQASKRVAASSSRH